MNTTKKRLRGAASSAYNRISRAVSICSAALFISSASLVHAAPIVSGNVISWPDDGWYQVQTSDGLTNLCNGGRSCIVEPGAYIVINHTVGMRFEGVEVTGDSDADGGITVTGNVIAWPDDGWYQVQTSDGLTNLCNGGRSCTVEAGTYIVINHTIGMRYEGIDVTGDGNGGPTSPEPDSGGDTLPGVVANALAVEFEVLNGVAAARVGALVERITQALRMDEAESLGLVRGPDYLQGDGMLFPVWQCPGGGQLINFGPSGLVADNNVSAEISRCAIGPYVIDGRVENSGGFNGEGRALRMNEVTVDDVRDLSTISAIDITLLSIADRPEGNELSVRDLMVERPADSYSVIAMDSVGEGPLLPGGGRGFSVSTIGVLGGFDSDGSGSNTRTTGAITFIDDGLAEGRPFGGRLLIESGEGSLDLDVLTDDPDRFRLFVSNDGSTSSYDVPWSESYRLRPVDIESVDLGL